MASSSSPPTVEFAQQFLASFAAALVAEDNDDRQKVPTSTPVQAGKAELRRLEPQLLQKNSFSSEKELVKPRGLTPDRVQTNISSPMHNDILQSQLSTAAVQAPKPMPLSQNSATVSTTKGYAAPSSWSTATAAPPRKLTPQRVPEGALAHGSPFRSASVTTNNPHSEGTRLPDPFSRPLPQRQSQQEPSFLLQSEFPALGSSAPSQLAKPKSRQPLAETLPEPDEGAFTTVATFHAACIRALPRLTVSAIRVLVNAAIIDGDAKEELPKPVVGLLLTRAALARYARTVIGQLSPELSLFPSPVVVAFAGCNDLLISSTPSFHAETSFPSVDGRPWSPATTHTTGECAQSVLLHRLSANLESVWDEVLVMQRRFRGDVSGLAPGVLDAPAALKAMGRLHPAAVDLLAARLLGMVADAALTAQDGEPPKIRQLSARLRGAGGAQQHTGSGRDGAKGSQGKKGAGVVLHRLPEVVRQSFANDPMQLFILDFLTAVDSARLTAALLPRVAAALKKALGAAAAATSNSSFTDAVVDARLFARLLALTMHAPNWAHSEYALEGAESTDAERRETRGLDRHALASRVPVCSATWTAAFDVGFVVKSAVQSGQPLAVIASVAVADILLRLAAVDPVATTTGWYIGAVKAVRDVQIRPVNRRGSGNAEKEVSSMPLLDIMVGGIMESEVGLGEVNGFSPRNEPEQQSYVFSDQEVWTAIGDVRLIRECCPALDELRRQLISPQNVRDSGQRVITRRITPLPTAGSNTVSSLKTGSSATSLPTASAGLRLSRAPIEAKDTTGVASGSDEDDVEATLRREFYKRMDGRLRELIRVVATSKPADEKATVEAYTKIATVLYPNTPQTVIAAAAHICAGHVGRQQRENGAQRGSDTREAGLESRLNGTVHESNTRGQSKESTEVGRPGSAVAGKRTPD